MPLLVSLLLTRLLADSELVGFIWISIWLLTKSSLMAVPVVVLVAARRLASELLEVAIDITYLLVPS